MAVIEVAGLRKAYGDRVAVDDISFDVAEGEIFGLLGPNGAGKTTTVECLAGLRRPDAGCVRVLGHDPFRDRTAVTASLGVQLQHADLPANLRVREAMALFAAFYPNPADPGELLDLLGLTAHTGVRFGKLSGGQRQRLSIALALIGRPRIAILDELTTGLDPAARRDTWDLISAVRERGVTIVLVTHFMAEAERLCDRVAVVNAGRIVACAAPSALTTQLDGPQRIRFIPSAPLTDNELTALPGVESVSRNGEELLVIGDEDALAVVTAHLARTGVLARRLRIEQPSLDDAYLALTAPAPAPASPVAG